MLPKDLIQKISDRRTGAGCDQLITINNSKNNVDADMEIFNPGGDRAEACGNGTRCIARILFDENKNKKLLRLFLGVVPWQGCRQKKLEMLLGQYIQIFP